MELTDVFESHSYDDVYGLDVVHSVACLQSVVEGIFESRSITHGDLEKILNHAEDVVEIASRLQAHFAPLSKEFALTHCLKDKVYDLVIFPIEGLIQLRLSKRIKEKHWATIKSAFFGEKSLIAEVNALQMYLN